ncbi:ABC transporter permease [Deminuibacter soli]|uniref:ABC transporter permease n=1 Tax=Deminuibacter soli TaxID=2291815 RepID=A0A3E1NDP2_9BACT|nr:ABC transporter permease [Deminuibacter soli]RFM25888.1 ABC transporter permease [Deminuibacter soli]
MLKNHLKIAWRNLMKYKFISFINLFGLTIGLTCCLLIATYIIHELSYDKYNTNASRIYRVTRSFTTTEGNISLHLGTVAPPIGPLLKHDFPDVEQQTTLLGMGTAPLRYEDKKFNESNVCFADENLSKVFTMHMVTGNIKSLAEPFSALLTEAQAQKYFGNTNPMNKMIRLSNQVNFKVAGIYKAFPSNAHMHPDILLSFASLNDSTLYGAKNLQTNWFNNSFFTYLLLPENYPVKQMEARFPAFLDAHAPRSSTGMMPSKISKLYLQPLTSIHLTSHLDSEAEENGDIKRVYIFSVIALFILLIACINYMNLSTARSTLRAKEIGIRKVVGASKKELLLQFLSESVLICWMSLLLACILLKLGMPWLSKISGTDLSIGMLLKWQVLVPVLLTPFIVGVLAGLYPALFMAAFQPVKTLKGLFKAGSKSISFRQVLVVAQFAISIILIITTLVVYSQLRYMEKKSLGFDKSQVVTIPWNIAIGNRFEAMRNDLLQQQSIKDVCRASRIPSGRLLDNSNAATVGDSIRPVNLELKYVVADYHFIPTFGITMAAGRNFSRDYGTDSTAFIVNESAAQMIGWKTPEKAIGQRFKYGSTIGTIVGVMHDFNFESLHQKIQPLILIPTDGTAQPFNRIAIKVTGASSATAIAQIQSVWKHYLPDEPFDYNFLDERFSQLYEAERRQQTIFTLFSCIAIFIASLGLLGLSAFTITQRIKEIGVRKVLGADTGSIVLMLSKDFLKLVAIAAVVAFPVAWYAMYQWLQAFAYRIGMPWYVFIIAGVLAGLVALVTVGVQAAKAAMNNPVKSLRSE